MSKVCKNIFSIFALLVLTFSVCLFTGCSNKVTSFNLDEYNEISEKAINNYFMSENLQEFEDKTVTFESVIEKNDEVNLEYKKNEADKDMVKGVFTNTSNAITVTTVSRIGNGDNVKLKALIKRTLIEKEYSVDVDSTLKCTETKKVEDFTYIYGKIVENQVTKYYLTEHAISDVFKNGVKNDVISYNTKLYKEFESVDLYLDDIKYLVIEVNASIGESFNPSGSNILLKLLSSPNTKVNKSENKYNIVATGEKVNVNSSITIIADKIYELDMNFINNNYSSYTKKMTAKGTNIEEKLNKEYSSIDKINIDYSVKAFDLVLTGFEKDQTVSAPNLNLGHVIN